MLVRGRGDACLPPILNLPSHLLSHIEGLDCTHTLTYIHTQMVLETKCSSHSLFPLLTGPTHLFLSQTIPSPQNQNQNQMKSQNNKPTDLCFSCYFIANIELDIICA